MIDHQTALSTIHEENESELSTLTTHSGNCNEDISSFTEKHSETNMSMRSKTFSVDSNSSSFQCFKEIIMSSSSIFQNPFYYFPDVKDPGIEDALTIMDEEPMVEDGCQVYKDMCKQLGIYPISKVCKSLNTEKLNLKYYVPCNMQMRAICKTLESNTYIQELNLQDNWLSVECCTYLATVLATNTTLKILNMKECRIGAEGMAALSEALEMSSIQELNLSFNSLENEGLKEGKTALAVNVNLTKLNLSHNEFTEEAVDYLYDILVDAYRLKELDLSWNCFNSPKCMKKLCEGLVENKTLQWLSLAWNGISSEKAVLPFVRYLKRSVSLRYLDFSNNLIGGPSMDILMKGVTESRSLEHLKIGNNVFSPLKAYTYAAILTRARNKPLRLLDMENMVVQKKFLNLLEHIRERGNNVIYGAVLTDYEIHGPFIPKVLFGRCKYLGMKSKKKKKRIDFSQFVLSLPHKPISTEEFRTALTAKKLDRCLDSNLIQAVQDHYMISKNNKIDCSQLVNDYLMLYPDTQLEPTRGKKIHEEKKLTKRTKRGRNNPSKGQKINQSREENNKSSFVTPEKKEKRVSMEQSVDRPATSTTLAKSTASLKHPASSGNLEENLNLMNAAESNQEYEESKKSALNASDVFFLE